MKKYVKVIIIIVAAFYLYCIASYFKGAPAGEIVKEGYMEQKIESVGVLVRSEALFTSDFDATLENVVLENETVSRGQRVATLYRGEVAPDIQAQLEAVNANIAELEQSPLGADVMGSDSSKIDSQISGRVDEIIFASYNKNYDKVKELYSSVIKLSEKKQALAGNEDKDGSTLENLKAQKKEIESKINLEKTELYAPSQGIYSSKIDGFESLINPSMLKDISVSDVEKLVKTDTHKSLNIKAGSPAAKIITDFDWYVALPVTVDDAEKLDIGEAVSLRFPDLCENVVSGTVSNVIIEKKSAAIVVVSNKYVDGIYGARVTDVEVVAKKFSGLKVPNSAIFEKDGKKLVYINLGGVAKLIEVDVLTGNEDYSIVSQKSSTEGSRLKVYDEVLTKQKNIYEGKLLT